MVILSLQHPPTTFLSLNFLVLPQPVTSFSVFLISSLISSSMSVILILLSSTTRFALIHLTICLFVCISQGFSLQAIETVSDNFKQKGHTLEGYERLRELVRSGPGLKNYKESRTVLPPSTASTSSHLLVIYVQDSRS